MIIQIQYTHDCPNAGPIIDRTRALAAAHPEVVVNAVLVQARSPVPEGFAGSPTVLIDGTNPFGGAPTEGPACVLQPPTPEEVETAILTLL